MLDFWFTVGAAVHNTSVLDLMRQNPPAFNAVTIKLQVDGDPAMILNTSGTLDGPATVYLRQGIRDYLVQKYGVALTPPISLYTAGKFCQLWNRTQARIEQGIMQANSAFSHVLSATPVPISQPLLALAGASLIDNDLSAALQNGQQQTIAAEFGGSPSEFAVIGKWINHPDFLPAQNSVLADWTHCREVMLWYPEFKYAVI